MRSTLIFLLRAVQLIALDKSSFTGKLRPRRFLAAESAETPTDRRYKRTQWHTGQSVKEASSLIDTLRSWYFSKGSLKPRKHPPLRRNQVAMEEGETLPPRINIENSCDQTRKHRTQPKTPTGSNYYRSHFGDLEIRVFLVGIRALARVGHFVLGWGVCRRCVVRWFGVATSATVLRLLQQE